MKEGMFIRSCYKENWKRRLPCHLSIRFFSKVPLKIALFGTDNFTVYSLNALCKYQATHPNVIESLDVITRLPKLSGRGLKTIKEAPAAEYAFRNDIRVLRAETDNDIIDLLKENYNLAIAVSYGKLIPGEFLSKLQYGGINVHPSLLPDLSGAAPLHRALLRRYPVTGVTIQTLHPTKFDKGRILLHSPEVTISKQETLSSLEEKLGNLGSECLIKVIDEYKFADDNNNIQSKYVPSFAAKVAPKEKNINFENNSIDTVLLKHRVLGRLNVFQPVKVKGDIIYKQIILDGIIDSKMIVEELYDEENLKQNKEVKMPKDLQLGEYEFYNYIPRSARNNGPGRSPAAGGKVCIIRLKDGFITPSKLLFQGYSSQTANQFHRSMGKRLIKSKKLKLSVK